jgi:hypothetical protein
MVQAERFFLRQSQHSACALRKTVKFVRHTSFLERKIAAENSRQIEL